MGRRRATHRRILLEIVATAGASVNDPGMQRVAGRHPALATSFDRLPVAHGDLGELASRPDGDGAGVLLRARDPIWNAVIDRHVIDLRRWLIQPRAPGHRRRIVGARVARDDRTLVTGDDHGIWIVG